MPQRRILGEIDGNERSRKELLIETKIRIRGRYLVGQRAGEIAEDKDLLKRTINKRIHHFVKEGTYKNNLRSGRPRKYSDRDKRLVLRIIRNELALTYAELKKQTNLNLSHETLRRILTTNGITNWCAKMRPALTEAIARLRLEFALRYLDFDWNDVIFSDECSVEMGVGKKRQ